MGVTSGFMSRIMPANPERAALIGKGCKRCGQFKPIESFCEDSVNLKMTWSGFSGRSTICALPRRRGIGEENLCGKRSDTLAEPSQRAPETGEGGVPKLMTAERHWTT